jgi:IgA Peptidase M64/Peptidase M64 N-terminus
VKKLALFAGVLLAAAPAWAAPRTLRVDFLHSGNATAEHFRVDRVVVEPLPWPGNPAHDVDTSNLGTYFFEVSDAATGRVLYSRGFSSIYGEWETTDEARRTTRTFSESLRFPMPPGRVRIVLEKRDAHNIFQEVWRFTIDPSAASVVHSTGTHGAGPLITFQHAGDPSTKLDLLILGDGYTAAERGKFEREARRLLDTFFATSPFKERRKQINVWGLVPAAPESGISDPAAGVHRESPLGTSYGAFGTDRYILTFDNERFRTIAAHAPYDVVEILTNSDTYGGGGIFGLYSIDPAGNAWAPYVFIHEFGHQLAGLADEYYSSQVAYLPPKEIVEPWEPNVTASPTDPKWKDLVPAGVPLPTPWPKAEYDRLTSEGEPRQSAATGARKAQPETDEELRARQARIAAVLASGPYAHVVGAFEGADYLEHGYYRPQQDCVMFSRDDLSFCAVCRRAVDAALDRFTVP